MTVHLFVDGTINGGNTLNSGGALVSTTKISLTLSRGIHVITAIYDTGVGYALGSSLLVIVTVQ